MNKANLARIVKNAKATVSRRSPEILTALGITGMITTTVLAVKATPKALMLVEDARFEKGEDLTVVEKVKVTWKPYAPAVVTGVFSTACLIGANSVNARRNAALATAYKISETALADYREKVIETIGEKKEQVVRDKVAEKRVEQNPVTKSEIIITEKGNTLCYDAAIGRYFKSDIETIKKAINNINREMTYNMYVSLNEFYDELSLPNVDIGDDLGWNMDDGLVEPHFSSQIADDGTPCIVLSYNIAPKYDFSKLM